MLNFANVKSAAPTAAAGKPRAEGEPAFNAWSKFKEGIAFGLSEDESAAKVLDQYAGHAVESADDLFAFFIVAAVMLSAPEYKRTAAESGKAYTAGIKSFRNIGNVRRTFAAAFGAVKEGAPVVVGESLSETVVTMLDTLAGGSGDDGRAFRKELRTLWNDACKGADRLAYYRDLAARQSTPKAPEPKAAPAPAPEAPAARKPGSPLLGKPRA